MTRNASTCLALNTLLIALCFSHGTALARGPADLINDPAEIGMTLPGKMAKSIKEERILDTNDGEGNQVIVARTTRAPGTRTPLHLHAGREGNGWREYGLCQCRHAGYL